MTQAPVSPQVSRMKLVILAAILFLGSAYFYQDPEWNGNSRLALTRAMIERGSFRIDAYQSQPDWETGDKALYKGHFYSDKAIGSSLLAAPFYFLLFRLGGVLGYTLNSVLIKHALTTIVLGIAFTINGLAMYLIAHRITGRSMQALVPTLAISFGTMLWPYSAVFYGHVAAAALLAVAFYLIFSLKGAADSPSYLRWFWTGLAIGLAFVTEYTAALVVAGLAVYALHKLRNHAIGLVVRAAIAGILGAALPVSLMLAYNLRVYGNAFSAGYAFEAENRFEAGMSSGFMGMHLPNLVNTYHITIDPQFGLFWQSPVLLLAALGFFWALRNPLYRAEGLLCLYSVGVMIAMNGGYYLWWGGSAFGPRLLIPALPFFIVPLALLPRGWTWATVFLGILSSGQMLIPLMGQIQTSKLVYRLHLHMFYVADAPFTGFSLLYNYGVPQIMRQYAAGTPSWTLGAALGLPYWWSLPALIVTESGLISVFPRETAAVGLSTDRGTPSGA